MLEQISWQALLLTPEVFLAIGACFILLLSAFTHGRGLQAAIPLLSQVCVLITALLCLNPFHFEAEAMPFEMIVQDASSALFKCVMALLTIVAISLSRHYVRNRAFMQGEYWVLMLFSLAGMMILVSSNHLLPLYLGLEIMTLPLYALVSMRRDNAQSPEAGMKYFVMGALASGILLYGLSMLYGACGTLSIPEINEILGTAGTGTHHIALFGLVFVVVGVAFKLGVAPFHMWVPDVYQGAPTSVALFIGSVSKIAAVGMAFRLLALLLPTLSTTWQPMLAVMAVLSLAIGNIAAIMQTNVKRMLAYSAISHMSFIFLAMLGTDVAKDLSIYLFYILIYAITTQGAFGVLGILSGEGGEIETVKDLKGLGRRRPIIAFLMLIFMFSLIGVPPMAGFYAKFLVLQLLVSNGLWLLALAAVVFSVIGAFYYLRVIKSMYFEEAELVFDPRIPLDAGCALALTGVATVVLGVMPGPLWALLQKMVG